MPENGRFTADDLISVPGGQLSAYGAGQAWQALIAAARRDGVIIRISSGYRSYDHQARLVRELGLWTPTHAGAAPPGRSAHGMGEAVDVVQDGPTMQWLAENAHLYGWIQNVSNEPWHFRYTGLGALGAGDPAVPAESAPSGAADQASGEGSMPPQPRADDRYSRGGTLVRRSGGKYFIRYELSPGVYIQWEVTDMEALERSGYNVDDAERARNPERDGGHLINAGNAAEIGQLHTSGDTVQDLWDDLLLLVNPNNPARDDPESLAVLAEALGRGMEISEEELDALLIQTGLWDDTNVIGAEWNDMSTAERLRKTEEAAGELADRYWDLVGVRIAFNDPQIMQWAEDVASGERSWASVIHEMQATAEENPESPYSRTTRDEAEEQLQRGIDIENQAAALRQSAEQYGIRYSEDQLAVWAERIVSNQASVADFENILREQAAAIYPGLPEGMSPTDYAQPYINTLQRVLEIATPSIFDDRIQQVMQSGSNLYEFERQLMATPDYQRTDNFRDSYSDMMAAVSRQLGFNA